MASACVNKFDNFPANTYPAYGWLSPRMSLSRDEDSSSSSSKMSKPNSSTKTKQSPPDLLSDPKAEIEDFEFRLEDPVAMLPADELFFDGKLMPLHLSNLKPSSVNEMMMMTSPETTTTATTSSSKSCREISGTDPHLFSPKAPRCSSRWRDLLGLKKLYLNANSKQQEQEHHSKTSASGVSTTTNTTNSKSIKHFLHRSGKSASSSSDSAYFSLPLLKDCDSESVSVSSSRLSLSSSSSGHEHEDLPRLSLDSDKPLNPPSPNPFILNRNPNPPRMRIVKAKTENNGNQTRTGRSPMRRESSSSTSRGVSVDSPRMNSSGKIVFQSLERSSSSPSSFNGGPRYKHRGMERSYSANVRVTPVLNVPVCSLRGSSKSGSVFGFGQFFSSSPQKRDCPSLNGGGGVGSRGQQSNNSRNRTDRT
ncbi:hypothetical protein CFOL_v3_18366 [Cephalotus follicularis]|uniref:Uncharacterized protein n=1 Tax=Cephalotus follicularis TaxID=3775 RepID=A0A1Q3C3Q8_CEPFO|nr:hypothetical protein CFOL_v3_18366 [Cephalotus follicularis]